MRFAVRLLLSAVVVVLVVALFFAGYVWLGMTAHARTGGDLAGLPLRGAVAILRDGRGVPHIAASNEHDLFFGQGYAEGSDRLFQMDLIRRYVTGHLAEIFGAPALASDREQRAVPVTAMAQAQWNRLDAHTRDVLQAFSDGVNAATEREPLPVEFRMLAYRPKHWTPQDSLAVAMATVLDLIDDWNAIAPRDAAYRAGGVRALNARFPLSDPCYDAPLLAGLGAMGPGKACDLRVALAELADARAPVGSNEWAAGAAHSGTGRALLANDPHLGLHVPGVWYLVDLHAPGYHVAGAAFPGNPGVVLGHNEHVAWGATDGTVASLSAFLPPPHLDPNAWQTETFAVRFGKTVTERYYRTPREFGVTTADGRFVLVRWAAYRHPASPMIAFDRLDRARSIDDALAALHAFTGPTHNFALADTSGRVAYALAGPIPNDPAWARWFHPAADLRAADYPPVPQALMPAVAPSRDAIVWTANNKMYAAGYPLRLSPQFASPYRAYRVAQLLRARQRYDVDYFRTMQMDALSLPEKELARAVAPSLRAADPAAAQALATWNGVMSGDSTAATLAQAVRVDLTQHRKGNMPVLLIAARRGEVPAPQALPSPAPWSVAGAVPVLHAFSSLGIDLLDGTTLPGRGDAFTLHVQYAGYSQSFRAVWDVGNWDDGGIVIPQGESGEPGSGHYTDQASAWVTGKLWPLPFSDGAVERTAVDRLTLRP